MDDYLKTISKLQKDKDNAYSERNKLVALLSKLYPSCLGLHPECEKWEEDWRTVVFINLPTGQCSWHIHESELELFSHLKHSSQAKWDGHSTEEKYQRCADVVDLERRAAFPLPRMEISNPDDLPHALSEWITLCRSGSVLTFEFEEFLKKHKLVATNIGAIGWTDLEHGQFKVTFNVDSIEVSK